MGTSEVRNSGKVTLRDIARHLNLSHATVSFVLNDRRDVTIPETTRQRVLDAARAMGYRPNRAARALVMGRTHMLALWMPTVREQYYAEALGTLHGLAMEAGYETLYCEALETESQSRIYDWPVDGVLAVDVQVESIRDGLPEGMPVVSIGSYVDHTVDCVEFDLSEAARLATRHLIERGCQRIVHLCEAKARFDKGGRAEVYQDEMERAGLRPEFAIAPTKVRSEIRSFFAEYVREHGVPDGVFTHNDSYGIACLRGLADVGVRVPEECCVVGLDGTQLGEYCHPSLSSVAQPMDEIAAKALNMLLARIRNPDREPQRHRLSPRLLVRESSSAGVVSLR